MARIFDLFVEPGTDGEGCDLVLENGDLKIDEGLRGIVFSSLFTDARRPASVVNVDPDSDPRGVSYDTPGKRRGSLLWLHERGTLRARDVEDARIRCVEALDWLRQEGIVEKIGVAAARDAFDRLLLTVTVERGRARRYAVLWDAELAAASFGDVIVKILSR